MSFNKEQFFVKVIENRVENEIFTEFQMNAICGSSDDDYYQKEDDTEYYRVYTKVVEDPQYNTIYTYNFFDQCEIILQNRAIRNYTSRPATEQELESIFEKKWEEVRFERNNLLKESDEESMIYLPDYWNLQSEEYKNSWLTYRQELRDITQSTTNPFEIQWPTKPIVT